MQVVCKQGLGALQHPPKVMSANKAVKVHGQLVVVQAVLNNVVSMLQQDGQAQEQHEGIPFAKLLRRRQGARFDGGVLWFHQIWGVSRGARGFAARRGEVVGE